MAPAWGQSFGYDGFGNLNAKTVTKGTAPSLSVAIDTTKNRIVGQSYDANGNLLSLPSGGVGTYDVENRLVCVACPPFGPPGTQYGYDGANKRIWKYTGGLDADGFGNATGLQIYVYGVDGKQLGTYVTTVQMGNAANPLLTDDASSLNVYFRGKKVATGPSGSTAFVQDRLGSSVKTYPYGEEKTPNGQDGWKFATYLRDTTTNLDYADQRYYTFQLARFMTADPSKASGRVSSPQSWNRYAYVGGDPINRTDRKGLDYCNDCLEATDGSGYIPGTGAGGGGGGGTQIVEWELYPGSEDGHWVVVTQSGTGPTGNTATAGTDDGKGAKDAMIEVNDLSTTSHAALDVQNDLRWLKQAINADKDCSNWLKNSNSTIDFMLNEYWSKDKPTMMAVGVGTFSDNTVNAVASTGGTNLPSGMLITINLNGAFFKSGPSSTVGHGVPEWVDGGSPQAQALILLHELAHDLGATGFINNDRGSDAAQTQNNGLVFWNCGKILGRLANP